MITILRKGTRVYILDGNMYETEGILIRELNGSSRIVIKIDYIGYSTMEVEMVNVEIIELQ